MARELSNAYDFRKPISVLNISEDHDAIEASLEDAVSLRYGDTIAGGGKTYALLEHTAQRVQLVGMRAIIALPSQLVIDQCVSDMEKRHPNVGCAGIHSGNHPKRVLGGIIAKINQVRGTGRGFVLFITHAALEILPMEFRDGWHLIVDETPSVTKSFVHNKLSQGVRAALKVESIGAKYCRIIPRNKGLWKRITAGKFEHTKDRANTMVSS
jgi:hypothetical protein